MKFNQKSVPGKSGGVGELVGTRLEACSYDWLGFAAIQLDSFYLLPTFLTGTNSWLGSPDLPDCKMGLSRRWALSQQFTFPAQ
jgi:hypothetical protein